MLKERLYLVILWFFENVQNIQNERFEIINNLLG